MLSLSVPDSLAGGCLLSLPVIPLAGNFYEHFVSAAGRLLRGKSGAGPLAWW